MGLESNTMGAPDFDKLEVIKTGSLDLAIAYTGTTVSAGTQTKVLTHSLGYKPVVMAFASLPDGTSLEQNLIPIPYVTFFQSGGLSGEFMSSTYYDVGTETVTFKVTHHTGTDYAPLVPTWTVQYYLLRPIAN